MSLRIALLSLAAALPALATMPSQNTQRAANVKVAATVSQPGTPTITSSAVGDGSVSLWFSPPSSNGGAAVSSYQVSCAAPGSLVSSQGNSSPININGLINGLLYQCTLAATNSAGTGWPTLPTNLTPAAPVPLNLPALAVRYEYDGDTLAVSNGRSDSMVRLAMIDAPELTEPYGTEARQCLANLLVTASVSVAEQSKDRYGRLVAKVYAGALDVNYALLRSGCAWLDRRRSYDPSYDLAEQYARRNMLGLWNLPTPQAPWDFRANGATVASNTFTWATERYTAYFAGSPTIDYPSAKDERWTFWQSNSGLWAQGGRLKVLAPSLGINAWTDIGSLADYAGQAAYDSD
jgi:endonuclease YncB( thermonuclease family)